MTSTFVATPAFMNTPMFRNSFEDEQLFDDLLLNLQKMENLPSAEQTYMTTSTIVIETPWSEFGKSRSARYAASSPLSSDSSTNAPRKSRKRSLEPVNSTPSVSSSSLSEEDGSVSNQSSVVLQKAINIPRIVKNDIRRKISSMFINVLNSTDFILMDSFFRKFCVPDVQLRKIPHPTDFTGCCDIFLPGMDLIVSYFGTTAILNPDAVYKIGETKIKQSVDTLDCELISTITLQLTKTYNAPPAKIAEFVLKQHKSRANHPKVVEESLKRSIKRAKKFEVNSYASYETTKQEIEQDEDYQNYFSQFDEMSLKSAIVTEEFPRFQIPYDFNLTAVVNFKINDQKRIVGITMVPLQMEMKEISL